MTEKSDESKKKTENAPRNEQVADIFLKVLMGGRLLAGGSGAFWSLFVHSDTPKEIASAAIGLGISYTAKMFQPVHEGNQQRLEKVGK
jgi:hypothetical protein